MLNPASATIQAGQASSVIVQVLGPGTSDPATGTVRLGEPITSVPTILPPVQPDGISYTAGVGQVTISGTPKNLPNTTWHWLDSTYTAKSGPGAPEPGTYSKITAVDSPPTVPANQAFTYTIQGETFTLIVQMPSYDPVSTKLKTLLASVTN